jgi:hypothetical protein
MNSIPEIIQENRRGYEALRAGVAGLSAADLRVRMEAGWTVSAVLAHLAFWDLRAITLIHRWSEGGVGDSAIDTDVINETTRRLCLTIEPEAAAALALTVAQEIDQLIESLSPEMVTAMQERGKTVRLNRAEHRRTHLAEIEKAVQASVRAGD